MRSQLHLNNPALVFIKLPNDLGTSIALLDSLKSLIAIASFSILFDVVQ